MREHKITSNALTIIHQRYYQGKPDRIAALQQARINDEVARKINLLREEKGLSQDELAQLVGVDTSVICQLEDADYEGDAIAMLNHIAAVFDKRVAIDLIPISNNCLFS
ncbi:transcriptional regulator [Scytonema sp. UIC 10036]|uniref:helix-turn-helix domain-containing protein n=1 Tax=Scytonema sp. UIC 10036 TaxID=2304196 RepID=UPI0012DA497E|nr:helix-turn-helix transcriptional regulator [Scytonema sp. UIC 10036]MUG98082.1 transcriptional regulator [Scytonema sp. UIC 10036]